MYCILNPIRVQGRNPKKAVHLFYVKHSNTVGWLLKRSLGFNVPGVGKKIRNRCLGRFRDSYFLPFHVLV
jgi:hypothetical protein